MCFIRNPPQKKFIFIIPQIFLIFKHSMKKAKKVYISRMETLSGRIPVYGMYAGNTAPGTAAQEQKRTQKTPPLAAPDNAAKQQNPIQQSAAAQSGFQAIPAAVECGKASHSICRSKQPDSQH